MLDKHGSRTMVQFDDGTEMAKLRDAHAEMADALAGMREKNDDLAGQVYVARAKLGAANGLARIAVTVCLGLTGALLLALVVIVLLVKR